MDNLFLAFTMLMQPDALIAIVAGSAIGIVIGVIGLGPAIAIALALPLTINMELVPSIALLLSLYVTAIYGGCVPSILLNVPGTPASAATALDGYRLARDGKAGLAITLATTASAVGGIISVGILFAAAPLLAKLALRFGPLELFLVGIFALTCIVVLERKFWIRAFLSALVGILIASVGQDPVSGGMRLIFGYFPLAGGVGLVPLLIGLFAISEVLIRAKQTRSVGSAKTGGLTIRFPKAHYWRRGAPLIVKSSLIGTVMGILPGAGPTAGSFVSYAEAKRSSRDPDLFGTGNPDGVVASEAANNAVTGGALVPALSLGIPGDAISALILAGLVLQGVVPGPRLYLDHYETVLLILLVLLFANIILFTFGLLGLRLWTLILKVPDTLLFGGIVVMATIGTFTTNNSTLDLGIMVAAGILGLVLQMANIPITPLIISFVLAPMLEVNLRQTIVVYGADPHVFIDRPISGALLVLILTIVTWPLLSRGVKAVARLSTNNS